MNIQEQDSFLPLTPQVFHILLALTQSQNMAGADIIRQVQTDSKKLIFLGSGTVYTAAKRLLLMGLIENPGEAKRVYRLTETGAFILQQEAERLAQAAKLAIDRAPDWSARRSATPKYFEP
jgi:DNA-binding PadR family transcriptional regulator